MLTNETKQRINTCRDILVGKLPDPKSQVIQITNALIYKFMDDQDRLAEKLGGKASFFIKELKPYAWHKLFDSKLTNQDRADLYIEGVQKLSEAKHLPELFQEIFKEAYVPFRAAQTITLFITEINKFDYNHSEELGNAYEYLLSIMGSQGDAGQFRTPRHIIEFMVDVVDPQKGETVYDPACGTAGFLISAYTHILEANNGKLSATERRKLGENISGIDISPDMAKMARVNLYLHGFNSPVINEGDTLSDEDLWGTKFDVILANPPFMSPKGGIIPHDKFGVKAKRAEVLFVDYIAEHLKLKGRAAIVVPEGVIFQSGTTYKALRKMLVDDGYLHSVISLPAGVFQPYSGVKTSILVLDREKAKEATEVLFLRIENDGYSLSTQRSEREGSHLLEALEISKNWQAGKKQESPIASWVTKKEIAETGDYNLTGERYRMFVAQASTWPIFPISEVLDDTLRGSGLSKKDFDDAGKNECIHYGQLYTVYNPVIETVVGRTNIDGVVKSVSGDVLVPATTTADAMGIAVSSALNKDGVILGGDINVLRTGNKVVLASYLSYLLNFPLKKELASFAKGTNILHLSIKDIVTIKIPVPPIEVQHKIVAELNRYQKIVDGARQIVENYRPSFAIKSTWSLMDLDLLVDITTGKLNANAASVEGKYPFFTCAKDVYKIDSFSFDTEALLLAGNNASADYDVKHYKGKFDAYQRTYVITIKDTNVIRYEYLRVALEAKLPELKSKSIGNLTKYLTLGVIKGLQIAVPTIEEQDMLVRLVEEERVYVNACSKLVSSFEQKIQDKIAEVWGE